VDLEAEFAAYVGGADHPPAPDPQDWYWELVAAGELVGP
jgi:hypothetical protein